VRPKDKAAIVKGLDGVFKEKRQVDENGVRQNQIYLAARRRWARWGRTASTCCSRGSATSRTRATSRCRSCLIRKLGKIHDPRGLKPLLKLLDDHEPKIQGAPARRWRPTTDRLWPSASRSSRSCSSS
jgi:hypothetical protein